MTSKAKNLTIQALLDLYSEALEHYIHAVAPAASFSDAASEVLSKKLGLLRQKFETLDEPELAAILTFCNSLAAKKERRAADLVAARLPFVLEGHPPRAGAPKKHLEKAQELIDVLGFPATLGKLKTKKQLPVKAVTDLVLDAYGSVLSPTEMDNVIAFHRSPTGKKYGEIARSAGVELTEAMF